MIRITVELPNRDADRIDRHVIEIVRSLQRADNHADYQVKFLEEMKIVQVTDFDRRRGWQALVAEALVRLEVPQSEARTETP